MVRCCRQKVIIHEMAFKTFRRIVKKRIHFLRLSHSFGTPVFRLLSTTEKEHCSGRWKVMFFGTDDFSLGSLRRLHEELLSRGTVSKLEVVSSKWRLNPVRLYSQSNGLVIHEWPLEASNMDGFDVGLVASFGHLIPKSIIDAFPLGIINVHGSLLPRWRGAAPVNYAIMNGDQVTGISMMRIRPHAFDIGEVISQRKVAISPTETAMQLRSRLSEIGGDELLSCIQGLPQCLSKAKPQSQEGVSYAPKITPNHGVLCFEKMSAQCIYNLYRALVGIVPLVTNWMGIQVSLCGIVPITISQQSLSQLVGFTRVENNTENFNPRTDGSCFPGQVLFDKKLKHIVVKCKGESYVAVNRIAPFRKKSMSALEFYNGYLSKQTKLHWYFYNK